VPDPISSGEISPAFRWDHLIYAYMIENTRVVEIMRRVVHEMAHGERLGTPTAESQRWLRTTEELFFKDGAPFFVGSLASQIRPDMRAIRRNAYQRLFGMELNHGTDDGQPLPYVKAEAANREFIATFEEFLREVWIGMIYVNATSTANPTDDARIAALAEKLSDMLRSRRQNGNLAREEFAAVCAMSWFHLTLEFESPIVKALRAESTGQEQVLFKIAERVGLPAHGLAKHFFEIADPISRLLIQIETGVYNQSAAVPALYTRVNPSAGSPENALRTIITHWSAITGRDVKSRKVAAG
jgi:transcriptional regulator with XRE-family HTH domain